MSIKPPHPHLNVAVQYDIYRVADAKTISTLFWGSGGVSYSIKSILNAYEPTCPHDFGQDCLKTSHRN